MDQAITTINAALAELVALHEPDFLSKLYATIDEEISLRDAIAISYVVDSTEDPLAEEALCVSPAARGLAALSPPTNPLLARPRWSFNYFFYNRSTRKILYFYCTAKRSARAPGGRRSRRRSADLGHRPRAASPQQIPLLRVEGADGAHSGVLPVRRPRCTGGNGAEHPGADRAAGLGRGPGGAAEKRPALCVDGDGGGRRRRRRGGGRRLGGHGKYWVTGQRVVRSLREAASPPPSCLVLRAPEARWG